MGKMKRSILPNQSLPSVRYQGGENPASLLRLFVRWMDTASTANNSEYSECSHAHYVQYKIGTLRQWQTEHLNFQRTPGELFE